MIYDITKTFEENAAYGPFWTDTYPPIKKTKPRYTFLGHPLNSLFGIPACPLTMNARYIHVMSRLGYDLLTYKSVRSVEWHGNVFPHWLYLNIPRSKKVTDLEKIQADFKAFPSQGVSMTNSFGIHSVHPVIWQQDFQFARAQLLPGQALILSMQTTSIKGKTMVQDATDLARLAVEAGADMVEINFACPNTEQGKGMIFDDVPLAHKICTAMKKVLGKRHLLAKVGFYKDDATIAEFLKQHKGVLSGVATANTYSAKIVNKQGKEVYPGRPVGGVSGAGIYDMAIRQARVFVEKKEELRLKDFVIIGIGGVAKPNEIKKYLGIHVDAVQSAVGAFADPLLAQKYKKTL